MCNVLYGMITLQYIRGVIQHMNAAVCDTILYHTCVYAPWLVA